MPNQDANSNQKGSNCLQESTKENTQQPSLYLSALVRQSCTLHVHPPTTLQSHCTAKPPESRVPLLVNITKQLFEVVSWLRVRDKYQEENGQRSEIQYQQKKRKKGESNEHSCKRQFNRVLDDNELHDKNYCVWERVTWQRRMKQSKKSHLPERHAKNKLNYQSSGWRLAMKRGINLTENCRCALKLHQEDVEHQ